MRVVADENISARIERLVAEEHDLRSREQGDDAEGLEKDAARLRAIEVELDVCWDLLRQRRALRDAGEDPAHAMPRDPDTVERYWQ